MEEDLDVQRIYSKQDFIVALENLPDVDKVAVGDDELYLLKKVGAAGKAYDIVRTLGYKSVMINGQEFFKISERYIYSLKETFEPHGKKVKDI